MVFWGVMMGSVAALMLVIGGADALSGIQNITIIMAAPFVLVMVVMCVALYKDLRQDPLVRRGQRGEAAIEQAIDFGTKTYGDSFYLGVKPTKADPDTDADVRPVASNGHAPEAGTPLPVRTDDVTERATAARAAAPEQI